MEEEVIESAQDDTIEGAVEGSGPTETMESSPTEGTEKIEVEAAEFEKLRSMIEQQETFIKRQSNEVGTSRQRVAELEKEVAKLQEVRNQVNDDFITGKQLEELQQLQVAESSLNSEREKLISYENQVFMNEIDPGFKDRIDTIAELMISDGYTTGEVGAFKETPYLADRAILTSYAKRAKQHQELQEMKDKLAKLDPNHIKGKIQEAAVNGTASSVTASTGGTATGEVEITSAVIKNMTSAQRKHFINTGEYINP